MKSNEKRNLILGSMILVLTITIGYFGLTTAKDSYATDGGTAGTENVPEPETNNCKITYDVGEGTGGPNPSTQSFTCENGTNLSEAEPTREGYKFQGWDTKSSANVVEYKSGAEYAGNTENKETTLYAVWKAYEVHIRLRVNEGTISTDNKNFIVGDDEYIYAMKNGNNFINIYNISYGETLETWGLLNPDNEEFLNITRDGFTLKKGKEWACDDYVPGNKCISTTYSDEEAYSADAFCDAKKDDCTVVLRVNWYKIYTVTYDVNTSDLNLVPKSQTKIKDETLTLYSDVLTRDGYKFKGWSEDKNATTAKYQPGAKYTENRDVTLFAVWEEDDEETTKYTVHFEANDGEGDMNDLECTKDEECTLTSNAFEREGYTFNGWNTEADGTGDDYKDGHTKKNFTTESEITLYAQWTKDVENDKTDEEITENSKTSNVLMFIAWTVGIGALAYTVYYYKTRKEN